MDQIYPPRGDKWTRFTLPKVQKMVNFTLPKVQKMVNFTLPKGANRPDLPSQRVQIDQIYPPKGAQMTEIPSQGCPNDRNTLPGVQIDQIYLPGVQIDQIYPPRVWSMGCPILVNGCPIVWSRAKCSGI